MNTLRTNLAMLIACVGLLGCGDGVGKDGDLVGGACDSADDCVERCERGPDFPGGTCTVSCLDDTDCPGGTLCVDEEGGICLLRCDLTSDCRLGYICDSQDRRGAAGEVLVCSD